MTKNLLVIYEGSGEEWAVYLKKLLTSHLQIDDVFLYDVNCESNEVVEDLTGSTWQCKLLVLTRDILKIFYENRSRNFFALLQPSHRVVLMLCGVDSPEGLYELFPFERDCYVILPDQDPQDYLSTVSNVLNEEHGDRTLSPSVRTTEASTRTSIVQEDITSFQPSSVLALPKRISCENPGELFIILSMEIPRNTEVEVELCTKNQLIRKKPKQWSEKILCLRAPGFAPGEVTVNVCFQEHITASTQIEYFSAVEDLKHLLLKTIDPVPFICQAFNVYTLAELDKVLMKSLKNRISSCEYNVHERTQHRISGSSEEIPTLLHCAAKLGLKEVALLLMQSPAADHFCKITNKYGDDPANMAEKYGHQEIQDIIHQLREKQKANQTDVLEESVEFEHEDVYVDMVECAAPQQSTADFCRYDDETEVDPVIQTGLDVQEYAGEEKIEEYAEEHMEPNGSDPMPDIPDDYCLLAPADNSSRPFETDEEEHNPVDEGDWLSTERDKSFKYPRENTYVPMPVHSIIEDPSNQEDHESLTPGLHSEHDASMHQGCFQEEVINKEDVSQGAWNECPEEQALNEYDEEPVLIASTVDDVYIIFENAIKDTQRGQKPFISHNLSTPEASSTPTIASGTSYSAQEERTGDNENEPHGEPDKYSEEGSDHEHDEDTVIVASTEDDMYIVFESSVKKKQMGPTSFLSRNPEPLETATSSVTESGASYSAQDEGRSERFNAQLFWDEYEDDEDPYSSIYNDDDELYIELPYETAEKQEERGRKSFIVHRAPAPAPRPQTTVPDIEDSYISKVFRQKEEEKKIYGTATYQDKMHLARYDPQTPAQHRPALSGQDELILLQEKVKMGVITMDEALQKFQQWQNEKSKLDLLQQKKLQQLRDDIIGDKTDEVYDKITIVHQPNAFPGKKRTTYGMFDNSIYQKNNKSAVLADKRDDQLKNPKKKLQ
ncbi:B-cell scaffold protein with ankyrin repeats [Dendropsophus ebraccatus]|uniref:B-cell scaffold protein with ankyrin repeats n=1 Tax=Dendropsophus ebraccatus TaxID=150705 RepID=UPI0038313F76